MNSKERYRNYIWSKRLRIAVIVLGLYMFFSSVTGRIFAGYAFPVAMQFGLLIAMQVIQFVAYFGGLMYFLSGTKMEKIYPGDASSLTLDDYKGQPAIKERTLFIKAALEGSGEIREMGGEMYKGMLLTGAPGTGKTYLAKCLAGDVGVPFFLLDASGLLSMWMGMGQIKVRRWFGSLKKEAKKYGAAVGFLDEVDSIGQNRGNVQGSNMGFSPRGMFGGGNVLNTILSCMDGLETPPGLRGWFMKKWYGLLKKPMPKPDWTIFVVASTNRAAVLDPALLRSGRFELIMNINPPSRAGMVDVIRYYIDKVAHDDEVDTERMATHLRGLTPADVKTAIVRSAVRFAVQEGRDKITEADVYRASVEAMLGVEQPPDETYAADQEQVAAHEAGHTIMLKAVTPERFPALVTIMPHAGTGRIGATLGVLLHQWIRARSSYPLDLLGRLMMVSMAGREGAALLTERMHLGFGGDRRNIKNLLFALIAEGAFGYSASMLLNEGNALGGPSIHASMTDKVNKYLEWLAGMTKKVLEDNRDILESLTALLVSKQTLTAEDLEKFFAENPVRPPEDFKWIWEWEATNYEGE